MLDDATVAQFRDQSNQTTRDIAGGAHLIWEAIGAQTLHAIRTRREY